MSSSAARRYANAFLQTAIEAGKLEKAREDILTLREAFLSTRELQLFLKSPIVNKAQKQAAISSIFEDKVDPLTFRLLNLLLKKNREELIEDISREFLLIYNVHHGIVDVEVTSASKINKQQMIALVKQLESTTGKTVNVKPVLNKELIGGLMIRIDDTVIDGTVKYKLNQLKDRLTSVVV